ncbi:MAG: PAC2 family protein [Nanoarchaeota archaeon]|nr:PAC2 family protein [Nanoarchaeota archaeon]MBU1631763.1 PAC2 family protein [Nanoarchaeota archaeon]MBU1876163.1 PAC2 family protein [Nanoarchaeota archaeon]
MKWEITQKAKTIPKLNNPIFIEGLPGIGNVGKIAVDFLIEELGAKKLYSFFSYRFPHSVFVNENNMVEMPRIEIYYKTFNGNGKSKKRDFLFLTGDIQPIDEESCYTFCEEILKIVKNHGCSEIITTGGIGLQNIPDKPKVFCTSNDSKLFKEYIKKDMLVEKNIFGVVGPIVGVSGILLGLGKKRGVKGVSLLAETYGSPLYLGIKGAKEVLRVIEKKFSLGINLKKMTKDIIEVENELMKKTKEWISESLTLAQAGAKAKNKEVSYIG